MFLFDQRLSRDTARPARHAEPKFPYLNQSGRCEAARIRELLDMWFDRFPSRAKDQLRHRFRSEDDLLHYGAFFELYLHALFGSIECEVEAIVPESSVALPVRAPDFRGRAPCGVEFLVEATIATDKSRKEAGTEKLIAHVYDLLDGVESLNFFLRVEVSGTIRSAPAHHDVVPVVEGFLRPLDPDAVGKARVGFSLRRLPRIEIPLDGGCLILSAIPRKPDARGRPGVRPVGMTGSAEASWVDDAVALRRAITSKATRYGKPDRPFIIAIDAINQHLDHWDIMEALFGTSSDSIPVVGGCKERRQLRRQPLGAWIGPDRPINRRVSAVVVLSSLVPWSIAACTPVVYHNPFAERPLSPDTLPLLARAVAVDGRMVVQDSASAAEVFGLPPRWPRVDRGNS